LSISSGCLLFDDTGSAAGQRRVPSERVLGTLCVCAVDSTAIDCASHFVSAGVKETAPVRAPLACQHAGRVRNFTATTARACGPIDALAGSRLTPQAKARHHWPRCLIRREIVCACRE